MAWVWFLDLCAGAAGNCCATLGRRRLAHSLLAKKYRAGGRSSLCRSPQYSSSYRAAFMARRHWKSDPRFGSPCVAVAAAGRPNARASRNPERNPETRQERCRRPQRSRLEFLAMMPLRDGSRALMFSTPIQRRIPTDCVTTARKCLPTWDNSSSGRSRTLQKTVPAGWRPGQGRMR